MKVYPRKSVKEDLALLSVKVPYLSLNVLKSVEVSKMILNTELESLKVFTGLSLSIQFLRSPSHFFW